VSIRVELSEASCATSQPTHPAPHPPPAQVYARLKASGLKPTSQILGRLFRVVRNHAQLVRTESSRQMAALSGSEA